MTVTSARGGIRNRMRKHLPNTYETRQVDLAQLDIRSSTRDKVTL